METVVSRKPFQGIMNIVRFNWHFYVIASITTILLAIGNHYTGLEWIFTIAIVFLLCSVFSSIAVSCFVYDFSGFYSFNWLPEIDFAKSNNIVSINAGFDETSAIIQSQFRDSQLTVLDFYNPRKHTEVSIKRARKKYPAYPGTITIETDMIPFPDQAAGIVFLIFAAHEIRDIRELESFFRELERILDSQGKIVMTEHLRDIPNFMAYNLGFVHFFPKSRWKNVVGNAALKITSEKKLTPFTTLFIIEKNGNPT